MNIEIIVNGEKLVLYHDTTITMECANPLFSQESIDGDVVYQFDIPIEGNEKALGLSNDIHIHNDKKYECNILVQGFNIISGKLVIMESKSNHFSVGVICNPYPDGFGDRLISKNPSQAISISKDKLSHESDWERFLKESTEEDSNIKFSPFVNEDCYGDDNDYFGMWMGLDKKKIVNRLFLDKNGDLITEQEKDPFIRVFCKKNQLSEDVTAVERNQFCWIPQIRLNTILKDIVESSGYSYVNHINKELDRIFIQGVKALDDTIRQYESTITEEHVRVTQNGIRYGKNSDKDYNDDNMLDENGRLVFHSSGKYRIHAVMAHPGVGYSNDIHFCIASDELFTDTIVDKNYDVTNIKFDWFKLDYNEEVYIPQSYVDVPLYVGWCLRRKNGGYVLFDGYYEYSILDAESVVLEDKEIFNIYSNQFNLSDVLPDVTNSQFLVQIIKTMGLAYYIDSRQKSIEIVSLKDLANSKSIDLSQYVMPRETIVKMQDEKKISVRLSSPEDKEIDEKNYIGEFDTIYLLPDPYKHTNKIAFVTNLNEYYIAQNVEDDNSVWTVQWEKYSGNNKPLEIGDGETDSIKMEPMIPEQESNLFVNHRNSINIPNLNIPFRAKSDIYKKNEKEIKEVNLLYQRGLTKFYKGKTVQFDNMLPVIPGEFSLKATGENSLGEKYLLPWMELTKKAKVVTYRLRLPILKVMEVMQLLQPQRLSYDNQVRFIMVDNIKSMPKRVSFEIGNTAENILCEIEAAAVN